MSGDTPRTNAAIIFPGSGIAMVRPEFAEELERELADAISHTSFYRETAKRLKLERDDAQASESIAQLAMERLRAYAVSQTQLLDRALKMMQMAGYGVALHDADHNNPVIAWMAEARAVLAKNPAKVDMSGEPFGDPHPLDCVHETDRELTRCAECGARRGMCLHPGNTDAPDLRHQSGTQLPAVGSPTPRTDELVRRLNASARIMPAELIAHARVLEVEAETLRAMQGERHQVGRQSPGADAIAVERVRQMEVEKWNPDHDDDHEDASLTHAALCYARLATFQIEDKPYAPILRGLVPIDWPWTPDSYKPKDARRNLVRAGALIAAEIDRLDRAEKLRTVAGKKPERCATGCYNLTPGATLCQVCGGDFWHSERQT